MKALMIFLIMAFSLSLFAQDVMKAENKYLGYVYQQKEHQTNDPKGDALLLWTSHQLPEYVKARLKGNSAELTKTRIQKIEALIEKYPEYKVVEDKKNDVDMTYSTDNPFHVAIELEGHKAPFKVKNMANMMKEVIAEEYKNGVEPKEGTIHKWSPDTQKDLKKRFKVFARMPKLLVALSHGLTSKYMVTGTEDSLTDYILSRPKDSINIEEMFRASYKINKGDVYLTLLTIENVLSRYWNIPNRDKREVTTRLKDITNYNYKTDKFGAWYHLFGIMLYGYAHGGLPARIVGGLESLGSHIFSKFKEDEKQEDVINWRGGPVGARLRRFVKKEKYKSFEMKPELLDEDCYMDLDEDFSKRLSKALKKQSKTASAQE